MVYDNAFTTDIDWLVTTQFGAVAHAFAKVIVHPLADTEPTVTVPELSVPTIDGDVPQDESVGAVPPK